MWPREAAARGTRDRRLPSAQRPVILFQVDALASRAASISSIIQPLPIPDTGKDDRSGAAHLLRIALHYPEICAEQEEDKDPPAYCCASNCSA